MAANRLAGGLGMVHIPAAPRPSPNPFCAMIRVFSLLVALLACSGLAAVPIAEVKAVNVLGAVSLITADGSSATVQEQQRVGAGARLKTGADSTVTLYFSTGAVAILQPQSEVVLQRFEQAPYAARLGSFVSLKEDPSTSHVQIKVLSGKIVGRTASLRDDSTFEILTPAGTTRILGTSWSVTVAGPNAEGGYDVAVSKPDGTLVVVTSSGEVALPDGASLTLTTNANGQNVGQTQSQLSSDQLDTILVAISQAMGQTYHLVSSSSVQSATNFVISASGL